MKKADIAMIILIASVSMMISFFVANSYFKYSGSATIQTVDKINSDIVEPSTKIFNKDAINPAVPVEIKDKSAVTVPVITTGTQ